MLHLSKEFYKVHGNVSDGVQIFCAGPCSSKSFVILATILAGEAAIITHTRSYHKDGAKTKAPRKKHDKTAKRRRVIDPIATRTQNLQEVPMLLESDALPLRHRAR
jgi:hypothetical protein